jgi:hypothetical protein
MSTARFPFPFPFLAPAALALAACSGAPPATGATTEPLACSIPASCPAVDAECLGAVDNSGLTRFGLRISQLDVTRPAGLAAGIVGRVVADDVLPDDVACNLPGAGTFSWLLRFDTEAGTLETGGARPPADPAAGYAFANEELLGWKLQPATFAVTLGADGSFGSAAAAAQDITVPMYVDADGSDAVILPLRGVRFTTGVLSASQACIGRYDLAALDPDNACFPGPESPAFQTGGTIEGAIRLEDADQVHLAAFGETLCARLAADAPAYVARDATGTLACRRDAAGQILFPGDTCSTAGATCPDAVAVAADFAASSVRIDG